MRSNAVKRSIFFNEIFSYNLIKMGAEILLNSFLAKTSDNLIFQKITAPILFNIF